MQIIQQIEQRLSQIDSSIYHQFQSKIQSFHSQKYSSLYNCIQSLNYQQNSELKSCLQSAKQQENQIEQIFKTTKQSYIQCYESIQQVDLQKEQNCLDQYELDLKNKLSALQFKQ